MRPALLRSTSSLLAVACLLAACAHGAPTASPEVLLLGETHDNATGHRLRADALRERIEAGWRPAIAMEQFDREQQPALDAAMRECKDADCVVARVVSGKSGWTWEYYTPVITLALNYGLPLVAANLSRTDAAKVMKEGFPAVLDAGTVARYGLDAPLPAVVLSAQVEEVRTGHCNMLPPDMLEPMARAQIARDVVMADALRPHATRGVVLIAGNGHVRRDIAVPVWLRAQGLASRSVGYVEHAAAAGEYDAQHAIPARLRRDPCRGVKGMAGKS